MILTYTGNRGHVVVTHKRKRYEAWRGKRLSPEPKDPAFIKDLLKTGVYYPAETQAGYAKSAVVKVFYCPFCEFTHNLKAVAAAHVRKEVEKLVQARLAVNEAKIEAALRALGAVPFDDEVPEKEIEKDPVSQGPTPVDEGDDSTGKMPVPPEAEPRLVPGISAEIEAEREKSPDIPPGVEEVEPPLPDAPLPPTEILNQVQDDRGGVQKDKAEKGGSKDTKGGAAPKGTKNEKSTGKMPVTPK